MTKSYRIKAFSELTNVTVRTLHYYDEVGLLNPSEKTAAGHRLYSEKDLLILQQIYTLKFLEFSLSSIKKIVLTDGFDLNNALKIQAEMLSSEAEKMNKASRLIQYLLTELQTSNKVEWKTVTNIIEVIKMNKSEQNQWEKKFLTADELSEFEMLKASRTNTEWDHYHQRWLKMLEEIENNLQNEPGSQIGQALAKKWISLVEEIYGNHPKLRYKMWEGMKSGAMPKENFPYTQEVMDYITQATNILKNKG